MARFYGSVQGTRGIVTRLGGASSGLTTVAAGWQGAVYVDLYDKDGVDYCTVRLGKWKGVGLSHVLYEGPVKPDGIGYAGHQEGFKLVGQRHKKDPA